ncbi:MAG: DUF2182 domain-containing protein [Verrucomicrobia bacterium]|nr:DUF2182 domain-containing protein [Verrucomicrobiota bacterium]
MDGVYLRRHASAMGAAQPGTDFSDDGGHEPPARQSSAHFGRHYQWTPFKYSCLRHCRAPLQFLLSYWRDGTRALSSWVCVTELTVLAVAGF